MSYNCELIITAGCGGKGSDKNQTTNPYHLANLNLLALFLICIDIDFLRKYLALSIVKCSSGRDYI